MQALFNTCTLSTKLNRKGAERRLSTKSDLEGQRGGLLRYFIARGAEKRVVVREVLVYEGSFKKIVCLKNK